MVSVYIVPLDAKKLNVNQYMFGVNSLYHKIQFDWNESYDFQDFMSYFQDLPSDQCFLVFKTKEAALKHTKSNKSVVPGYIINIRSRVPVYKVELQAEFDAIPSNDQQKNISKSDIKTLLSSTLELYSSECDIQKQQQEKTEFDANIEKLKGFASHALMTPNVKKSINDVIDCIQQSTYKSLDFEEKKSITEKAILFIEGKIAPSEYKSTIQRSYLGEPSSVELKILGGVLMALAIAVAACLLSSGAPAIGSLLIGAGLGMIGHTFFNMGQGSGVSKPLHEILDAWTAFTPLRAS